MLVLCVVEVLEVDLVKGVLVPVGGADLLVFCMVEVWKAGLV